MKAAIALVSLAAFGFVVAGCGSGTTNDRRHSHPLIPTGPVTVVGTTTIAHMPTGAPIHCKHGTGAEVPKPGEGVTGNADGPSSSSEIQVTHRRDGSVVASCRSS
jgi:hypothetical protein